jgi:SAM-dependent methyltransferase
MMNPEEIATQYDRIGERYIAAQERFIAEHGERQPTLFIREAIGDLAHKHVLDLGCGDGRDVVHYAGNGADFVTGYDSSWFMVEKARDRVRDSEFLGVEVTRRGLEQDWVKHAKQDVVTAKFSLHYARDIDRVYRNVAGIMKPGGTFAFVVHHPMSQALLPCSLDDENKYVTEYELFDEEIPVRIPFHNLEDYFSPTFFELFDMVGFTECQDECVNYDNAYDIGYDVPSFMGVKAVRRGG